MARVGLESWSSSFAKHVLEDEEANEAQPFVQPTKTAAKKSSLTAKIYLVTFIVIVFIGAALMSCVAPFFPTRAMQKDVSQTLVGVIMASAPIVGFVFSWIFAVFMFQIGVKFLLVSGMFVTGCCAIMFGVIDFCPPGISFTVLGFLLRSVEGIGIAMYFNSCYTMSGILFADNYGFVMGILETSTSLGTLLGPSIGGALYAAGGYFLPFAVLGGALILLNPLAMFMIPANIADSVDTTADEHNPIRVIRKMATPTVLITAFTMLSATASWIFTETTLGVRLSHFDVTDPLIVGAIYLAASGAYAIAAPLSGQIADKFDKAWAIILTGTVLLIVGYLIIGPSPILLSQIIPEGLPQLIIGCLCTHTGLAAVVVPTTKALQKQAEMSGLDPNSIGTLAFITSIFQMVWFMGGFIGSIISSALMEHLGYGWATTIQAGIVLISLILQSLVLLRIRHLKCIICFKKRQYDQID